MYASKVRNSIIFHASVSSVNFEPQLPIISRLSLSSKDFFRKIRTKDYIFHEIKRLKGAGTTMRRSVFLKEFCTWCFLLESTGHWRRDVENFTGKAALNQFYGAAIAMVLCTCPSPILRFRELSRRVQGENREKRSQFIRSLRRHCGIACCTEKKMTRWCWTKRRFTKRIWKSVQVC